MNPVVTVIVATHSRPDTLREALLSVAEQTHGDFECLVVDDAGDVPAVVPSDPRFRILRLDRNVGCAEARNIGLRGARGGAVAFLDDDDVYAPRRLEEGLRGLHRAPVSLVARFTLGGDRPRTGLRFTGDCRDTILNGYTPHLGQVVMRREDVQPLDPSWSALEDVEWWLRTAAKHRFHTSDYLGYGVRRHDGVRVGNGADARLAASLRLLEQEAEYFASHRRALAFRHERVAFMYRAIGDHSRARKHFWQSIKARPDLPNAWRIARSPGW